MVEFNKKARQAAVIIEEMGIMIDNNENIKQYLFDLNTINTDLDEDGKDMAYSYLADVLYNH